MSFVVALALAIALLVAVPVLAHLLRRGRARETPFPPTRLIPIKEHVAKRPSRFEDRVLLAVRSTIIVVVALLGATPLVRCERAVFTRRDGASIAVVIVLDDSGSMRSLLGQGGSRFSRAKRTAIELLDQLHEGDSIGLVLAGKPARMLLLPTANLALLQRQIEAVGESDRSTDLASAIALAESALDRQPHLDKRVIVLSDLASPLPALSARVFTPLPELTGITKDCGVISAVRSRGRVRVDVACSGAYPSVERSLQLLTVAQPTKVVQEKTVKLHPLREVFELDGIGGSEPSFVRLLGEDDNAHDDTTPVVDDGDGPTVATYSDPIAGRGSTGGPPILEQALYALNPNLRIVSLSTVPEDSTELSGIRLLLLDDPPFLSAESRSTIVGFAERGGTAVAFFGPAANEAQLGSLLLPFVERRAIWENEAPAGLDPTSMSDLGAAATSFADITPKGRLSFDESHDPKVVIRGRWSDRMPFWIERPLGRGLVMTLGLPTSVAQSDMGLRSGFIALLEQILGTTERLGFARVTSVGSLWRFPELTRSEFTEIRVVGPSGPLPLYDGGASNQSEYAFVPTEMGRYQVKLGGKSEERIALYPAEEVLEASRTAAVTATPRQDRAAGRLDLSRWLALALMPLLGLELGIGSSRLRGFLREFGQSLRKGRWPHRTDRPG
jgi:hypothetical protein